jgi:sporulation protein YlmC with PRC-barrel domain
MIKRGDRVKRASRLLGMRIYSDRGKYVGAVEDVVLEDREGVIVGLVFGRKAGRALTIPYRSIMAIGDIILVYSKREEESGGVIS